MEVVSVMISSFFVPLSMDQTSCAIAKKLVRRLSEIRSLCCGTMIQDVQGIAPVFKTVRCAAEDRDC